MPGTKRHRIKAPATILQICTSKWILFQTDNRRIENKYETSDEKPPHSYIALISMAILESCEKKLVLGDIYQFVMDRFPFYNNQERAWRNSIRHNLSLNECFIKAGRAENGKGNYWAIHPACVGDFSKGDYRRRHARRRARGTSYSDLPPATPLPLSYAPNINNFVPMTPSSLLAYPFPVPFLHQAIPRTATTSLASYNSHLDAVATLATLVAQQNNKTTCDISNDLPQPLQPLQTTLTPRHFLTPATIELPSRIPSQKIQLPYKRQQFLPPPFRLTYF